MLRLLFFIMFVMSSTVFAVEKETPLVVSVEWLAQHLEDENIVIIDVRKKEAYQKGHIKGAVNMPVMEDFFTKKDLKLPSLSFLTNLFSNAGIDKNTHVIVYDNGQFCWAARAIWVLKLLGHNKGSFLEYSYGKYVQKHLPISTKAPHLVKKEFIPMINNNMIATKLDTLMAIGKDIILDGRTKEMYMGKVSIAKRYGHIPTAKLFSGLNNYKKTEDGHKLKSFDKLKKVYASLPKEKKMILYCQDGADAALDDLIMQRLGFKNTVVYEGGWIEWGNDERLPIENPSVKEKK